MQFYKYEGFNMDESQSDENESLRARRQKNRNLAIKSKMFNRKLDRKGYFYIADIVCDTVLIGIIWCGFSGIEKELEAYIEALGLDLENPSLEEVTFELMHSMLQDSCHNSFIDDDDEVLEKFELNNLTCHWRRELPYGENIIEDRLKEDVYKETEKFLARETYIPELDRIYADVPKGKVYGHPVHYMIQTDDADIRRSMHLTLLEALYANGRLRNRRYVFADFNPGMEFSRIFYDCLYKSCTGGAVIVRYLANDDSEDDRASSGRDTIETLCEVMRKYSNQVLTVFCLPRECTKSKDIFYEYLGPVSIVELKEEFVSGECAENFLKAIARESHIRTDRKLFAKLEEGKGYLAPELHDIFDEWYNNKLKTGIYPQYKDIVTIRSETVKKPHRGSAYKELTEMIGLGDAKKVINQALNYYKAQKLFAEKGMKEDRPAMHMVFTGNPGTAKTTAARLFAEIMKENGLLSKGRLIEVGRGDLVGKYVGWTAPTIKKKFKEAQGSVLFIDEAYSLVDDRDGSFGDEAINTIVQEMENHRDDVVVIFAGYPDKMEGFLQKNPGLRSRIAFHVPFSDYSTEELCGIADLIAEKKGLVLTGGTREKLESIFETARVQSDFGNGRYVRNVLERAKMVQATRLLSMEFDDIKKDDIVTILPEDIESPAETNKTQKNRIGFSA